ncbi:PAS domain S-box protein [Carboxylicivirga sp. N1Y90]|uniref:PAS domain S-box protein n=1 Tax=Carboxylicivirga fragile TaxID=3417571 RepID=UPI003D346D8C|nr:PAS domain S-box protein [Marinilabiliaceae bacterium N1Y90]
MDNQNKSQKELLKKLDDLQRKYNSLQNTYDRVIADQKQTELDLKEREINYFGLFNTVKQAIYIQNPDLTFVNVNQGAIDLYGYEREYFIGKTPEFLSAPGKNDLNKVAKLIERAFNGEPQFFEFWGLKKDGTIFPKDVWTVKGSYFGKDVVITFAADITEKKQFLNDLIVAKVKAEESEQQFKSLYQNAADAIFIADPETSLILDANRAAEKLMQMTRGELVGLHQSRLHPPEKEDYTKKTFKQHAKDAQELVHTNRVENLIVRKDGTTVPVEVLPFEVKYKGKKCLVGSFRDISARKEVEEELLQAKEIAEANNANVTAIIEGTEDSIWAFDVKYDIIYINKVFQRDFNKAFGVLLLPGSNLIDALPKAIRGFWKPRYDRVLAGESYTVEDIVEGVNGNIYIQISFNPIIKDSKVIGGSCFGSDITARKLSEIELIRAKEHAEESDHLKTSFLQNMSHEIRTPLNAISGFSGLLNEPDLSKEKREGYVSIIQNSSNQLVSIVTDVLTISAIETNQEQKNVGEASVNLIVADLLTIFQQQASDKNVELVSNMSLKDHEAEIYTDGTKLTQVLSNLIANALKFTYRGSVEIGCSLVKNDLEFYVKDTGIGVKPEFHEKIFERFRQADVLISREFGGTGLGLSISKAFVELLGGKIWLESEIEKGTTIYFTIPYEPIIKVDEEGAVVKQSEQVRTVLVAEDVKNNFLYLDAILTGMSFVVIHVKNGKDAIVACNSNPNIDLVLMDIKMPVMDGYEAAKLIKQSHPKIPILGQSAYVLENELAKYKGVFDDYLTKPISKDLLKQKVLEYIS